MRVNCRGKRGTCLQNKHGEKIGSFARRSLVFYLSVIDGDDSCGRLDDVTTVWKQIEVVETNETGPEFEWKANAVEGKCQQQKFQIYSAQGGSLAFDL